MEGFAGSRQAKKDRARDDLRYDDMLSERRADRAAYGGGFGGGFGGGGGRSVMPGSPGNAGGGAVGVPTNSGWVVDGLVARGMAQHHAEGFAINFGDESNFNTGAVGDNGNAYGLAQWNGPRKRALEAFAAAQGKPARDGDVQLDFLMHELGSNEAGAWAKIQNAGDRGSAAAAVLNLFERPAEEHRARREAAYLGGNHSRYRQPAPTAKPRSILGQSPPALSFGKSTPVGVKAKVDPLAYILGKMK